MRKDIDKEEWDFWVNSCPVATFKNFHGNKWMIFKDHESFKEWLKAIPILKEEKDDQCLAVDQKSI